MLFYFSEEDECDESDGIASIQSVEDGSVNCSRSASVGELLVTLDRRVIFALRTLAGDSLFEALDFLHVFCIVLSN